MDFLPGLTAFSWRGFRVFLTPSATRAALASCNRLFQFRHDGRLGPRCFCFSVNEGFRPFRHFAHSFSCHFLTVWARYESWVFAPATPLIISTLVTHQPQATAKTIHGYAPCKILNNDGRSCWGIAPAGMSSIRCGSWYPNEFMVNTIPYFAAIFAR